MKFYADCFFRFRNFGPFEVSLSSDNEFTIGNSKITATVSACDGSLKVRLNNKLDAYYIWYAILLILAHYSSLKPKEQAPLVW